MGYNYGFEIFWSAEDEGYIATCPEFPGLSAFGETREEATKEAETALELFIEEYKAKGKPLPEPTGLDAFSGQLRLRMPKSLHRKLAEAARREETSLNQYIVYLLSEQHAYRDSELAMAGSAPASRKVSEDKAKYGSKKSVKN